MSLRNDLIVDLLDLPEGTVSGVDIVVDALMPRIEATLATLASEYRYHMADVETMPDTLYLDANRRIDAITKPLGVNSWPKPKEQQA